MEEVLPHIVGSRQSPSILPDTGDEEKEEIRPEHFYFLDEAANRPAVQLFAPVATEKTQESVPMPENRIDEEAIELLKNLAQSPSNGHQDVKNLLLDSSAIQQHAESEILVEEAMRSESEDNISVSEPPTSPIESVKHVTGFAMLEFNDGHFYMTTYSVDIGRDTMAARQAEEQYHEEALSARVNDSSTDNEDQGPRVGGRSVTSESGGVVSMLPEEPVLSYRRRTRSVGSVAKGACEALASGNGIFTEEDLDTMPETILVAPEEECPFLPIHPPALAEPNTAGHHNGISRLHARIAYSFGKNLFELHVKGRNGAFVNGKHFQKNQVTELRDGSLIQIGGVYMRFYLPVAQGGDTGAPGTSASDGYSLMSVDFEDGRGESIPAPTTSSSSDSSEDSSDTDERLPERRLPVKRIERNSDGEDEDDEASGPERRISRGGKGKRKGKEKAATSSKLKLKTKATAKPKATEGSKSPPDRSSADLDEEALKSMGIDLPLAMIPPRRKGPGRPPKNGIMSKREEAVLRKQAREHARAQAVANGSLPPESLQSALESVERRKLTKKNGDKDIVESIEGNDGSSTAVKPPKEKKPAKPPKSPSPFIDEASLTPEQLAKPQHSYVVMIHEALSNCAAGKMSLPQIYKAIERKYPYFKFKVTTPGWQSSIRHNLSQHAAFKKTEEREGKGWMWCLDPDVSIEKDKRPKRPSPPVQQQQPFLPPGQAIYRPPFGIPGVVNGLPGQYHARPGGLVASQTGPNGQPNLGSTLAGPHGSPQNSITRAAPSAAITGNTTTRSPYLLAQNAHQPARSSPLVPLNGINQAQQVFQASQTALSAIQKYKSTLMTTLTMPNKEAIVDAVVSKVLGRPYTIFADANDQNAAETIELPLVGLLQHMNKQEAEKQRLAGLPTVQGARPIPSATTTQLPAANATVPAPADRANATNTSATTSVAAAPVPESAVTTTMANMASTTIPQPTQQNDRPSQQNLQAASPAPVASVATAQVNTGSQSDTPIPSPLTPAYAATPERTNQLASDSMNQPPNPPVSQAQGATTTTSTATSNQFLSLLSQLGSTASTNSNAQSSSRGLKRSFETDDEDRNHSHGSSIDQRAVKRVLLK